MKIQIKTMIGMAVLVGMASCRYDLDPITKVAPAADAAAPTLDLIYPVNNTKVQEREETVKITVKVNAYDDVEIGKVVVDLDGKQIASFTGSSYPDYRRLLLSFTAEAITNGNHTMTFSATDLSGKTTTQSVNFSKIPAYQPRPNEAFYMPFDGDANEKVAITDATATGSPKYEAGKKGSAYFGATESYITYPLSADLKGQEMTYAFWYKVNASPDRSGIFAVGAMSTVKTEENRKHGIRIFREGNAGQQQIKVNIGTGEKEVWNDGTPVTPGGDWVHLAVVISRTNSIVYLNGVPIKSAALSAPISWEGCTSMTIASGAPTFILWNHLSDFSGYDEFRIFNKALSEEEIVALKNL